MAALSQRKDIAELLNAFEKINRHDVKDFASGNLNESKCLKVGQTLWNADKPIFGSTVGAGVREEGDEVMERLPKIPLDRNQRANKYKQPLTSSKVSFDESLPRFESRLPKAAAQLHPPRQTKQVSEFYDSVVDFSLGTKGPLYTLCRHDAVKEIEKNRKQESIYAQLHPPQLPKLDHDGGKPSLSRKIKLDDFGVVTKSDAFRQQMEERVELKHQGQNKERIIRNLLSRYRHRLDTISSSHRKVTDDDVMRSPKYDDVGDDEDEEDVDSSVVFQRKIATDDTLHQLINIDNCHIIQQLRRLQQMTDNDVTACASAVKTSQDDFRRLMTQLNELKSATTVSDVDITELAADVRRKESTISVINDTLVDLNRQIDIAETALTPLLIEAAKTPADFLQLKPNKVPTIAEDVHQLQTELGHLVHQYETLCRSRDNDHVTRRDFDNRRTTLCAIQDDIGLYTRLNTDVISVIDEKKLEVNEMMAMLNISERDRSSIMSVIETPSTALTEDNIEELIAQLETGRFLLADENLLRQNDNPWSFYIS